MKTNNLDADLKSVIERLLENGQRINQRARKKYWYPLSIATYGIEEVTSALTAMCRFETTMWEKTATFEKYFARAVGAHSAVMVNSGSSADLLIAYHLTNPQAALLTRGDEILIPAVTWPTQIWSALMAGLKVRLVDVDPTTLNIDLTDLERKIGPRTRAIFLVHLLGNPCEMDAISAIAKSKDLIIAEDCCEALGSTYGGIHVGNFGIAASFSFFFSHHLTTMEGGMVTCPGQEDADDFRILRAHGWSRNLQAPQYDLNEFSDIDSRYAFVNWGFNVRPTEIQASFGLAQLEKMPAFQNQRILLANRFRKYIQTTEWLTVPRVSAKSVPCWMQLPVMVHPRAPFLRNELVKYLEDEGVESRPIVAGNIARQPVSQLFPELKKDVLLGADQIHDQGFYIGLSPLFTEAMVDRLIDTFNKFISLKKENFSRPLA